MVVSAHGNAFVSTLAHLKKNRSFRRAYLLDMPDFSQKVADSKGRAFRRAPQSVKHFISKSAFSGVWTPFAREKGSKNRLHAKINLKNYPVDDF